MLASSAQNYCFDPSPVGAVAGGGPSSGLLGDDGTSADLSGCAAFSAGCAGVAGVVLEAFSPDGGSIGVTGEGTYCSGGDWDGGAGVGEAAAGIVRNE